MSSSQTQLIIIKQNNDIELYDVKELVLIVEQKKLRVMYGYGSFVNVPFYRNFVQQNVFQRIIYSEEPANDSNKYVLIFSDTQECVRFIETVKSNNSCKYLCINVSKDDEIFKTNFLIPITVMACQHLLLEELLESMITEMIEYYKESDSNVSSNSNVQNMLLENTDIFRQNESGGPRRSLRLRTKNVCYKNCEMKKSCGRKWPTRRNPFK